ncbi:MAG: hypothetical protein WBV28_03395 [Terracidiphilus sp.]
MATNSHQNSHRESRRIFFRGTGLFALEQQQHDGRLVAVCLYNHLILCMLRIAQSLVQIKVNRRVYRAIAIKSAEVMQSGSGSRSGCHSWSASELRIAPD